MSKRVYRCVYRCVFLGVFHGVNIMKFDLPYDGGNTEHLRVTRGGDGNGNFVQLHRNYKQVWPGRGGWEAPSILPLSKHWAMYKLAPKERGPHTWCFWCLYMNDMVDTWPKHCLPPWCWAGSSSPDCPYGSLPVWNFMLMNQCLLVLWKQRWMITIMSSLEWSWHIPSYIVGPCLPFSTANCMRQLPMGLPTPDLV